MKLTSRQLNGWGLLITLAMLAGSYILEYGLGLTPCPLCVLTRWTVVLIAVVFLLALLHNPKKTGVRIYALVNLLLAVLGIVINVRHIWLQNLPPDQAPACAPGLDYMLQVMPLKDVLIKIFSGTAECSAVDWQFLKLTLPEWTLIFIVILVMINLYLLVKKQPGEK
jgi:disulfide bond formation protein DsbB